MLSSRIQLDVLSFSVNFHLFVAGKVFELSALPLHPEDEIKLKVHSNASFCSPFDSELRRKRNRRVRPSENSFTGPAPTGGKAGSLALLLSLSLLYCYNYFSIVFTFIKFASGVAPLLTDCLLFRPLAMTLKFYLAPLYSKQRQPTPIPW